MTVNDHASQERYVALYAWLCGQMSPRTPHAADLFAQDSECLYDAFLSVLVGTRLGFADYDDNQAHHGLYVFDFFVGDIEAPPLGRGVDGQRVPGMAGDPAAGGARAGRRGNCGDSEAGEASASGEAGHGLVTPRDPLERPIILRTEMVAGHAGPSGREGRWAARCEEFAFALGQVGVSL